MKDWKGAIIAEGLSDPTVVNSFHIDKAGITGENMPIDYEGHIGRWHWYDVRCSRDEIDALQPYLLRGWYAHFWNEDRMIVVYDDRQFEVARHDRRTWTEAIEHGRAQGIPEEELDFATD
jgi:hypothetical protein